MADSATTRNRFRKPESGQYVNAWAPELNEDFGSDRLDQALDGVLAFALSGSKTLTSTNYETDEARMRQIHITGGTGGTVTIPAVEKYYMVRNSASGAVVFTCGGVTASIAAGSVSFVLCNGTNCYADSSSADAAAAAVSAAEALASQSAAATSASNASTSETNAAASAVSAAASAAAAAASAANAWTQIGSTQSPSGVASVTFSSIPATYQDLKLEFLGLSPSANTPQLKIELSDNNGTNWTTAQNVSGTVSAASGGIYGGALITDYRSAAGNVSASASDLSSADRTSGSSVTLVTPWRIAAGINAIRLTWSGAENFDAGSVKLKGK